MIEEMLCEARERKRSIVRLCKHFHHSMFSYKRSNQNNFCLKIAYDEIIFVRSKGAEAEHSTPM